MAALRALDRDVAAELAARVLSEISGAGMPSAPLYDVAGEAENWAAMAEPAELAAYLTACFSRLSEADRAAFLQHGGAA